MINIYFFSLIFFFKICLSAVTYEMSGGRLGDNLIAYFHAKWISYKFDIPVLFKEFPLSNQLVMYQEEKKYNKINRSKYKKIFRFTRHHIAKVEKSDTLYIIPFFGEVLEEHLRNNWPYFQVDWNDPAFKDIIKKFLCPINKLDLIDIPRDKVSVAIHVRTGTGYEKNLTRSFPFKAPPRDFYVQALKEIIQNFEDRAFYIFLFTDDPAPNNIIREFKQSIGSMPTKNIEWDWRKKGNLHTLNILKDFFSIPKFDCLIRSESNFSFMAAQLGNFLIEISPKTHYICSVLKKIDNKEKVFI